MGIFDFLKKKEKTATNEQLNEEILKKDEIIVDESDSDVDQSIELLENTKDNKPNSSYVDAKLEEKAKISLENDFVENQFIEEEIKPRDIEEAIEVVIEEVVTEVKETVVPEIKEELAQELVEELIEDVIEVEKEEEAIARELDLEKEEEILNNLVNDIEEIAQEEEEKEAEEEAKEQEEKVSFFAKMKNGLLKTRDSLTSSIDNVFKAFTSVSDDFYDELEETLIFSDLGAKTSMDIIDELKERVSKEKIKDTEEVKGVLIDIITEILTKEETPLVIEPPTIILVIGVNGVGKTTTIGKLANLYKNEGKTVMLAAGDTFRAAAIEQLELWGERSDIPVIKHAENTDSSAVIYDAIASAKAKKTDVLICDTAGRLHNKKNLMAELEKINRVINKEYPNAKLETFLVLDGTTGQNALEQAKQFNEVCDVTGLVLTKLDGTAKGGVVIAIKNEMNLPVRFVGVGEGITDLQPFDAEVFAKALFDESN